MARSINFRVLMDTPDRFWFGLIGGCLAFAVLLLSLDPVCKGSQYVLRAILGLEALLPLKTGHGVSSEEMSAPNHAISRTLWENLAVEKAESPETSAMW